MPLAGCYVLTLNCENAYTRSGANRNHMLRRGRYDPSHTFTAETGGGAHSKARKAGWKMTKTGTFCPGCVEAGQTTPVT